MNRSIAFLFSGQGAQYPGMMQELYDSVLACKALFDTADKVLGRSISGLCFDGSREELNLTNNTQPCMLAADLAAWMALSSRGIKPRAVAGFSLGEYAALTASGVLTIEDVFRFVQLRAGAMQEAVPAGHGGMAAVMGLSKDETVNLCGRVSGYIVPANYNCPGQIVVSGEMSAVDELMSIAKGEKIKVIKLPVSGPFHCELMRPAADKLKTALEEIAINDPCFPVYMNVDALPEASGSAVIEKLILQTTSPVMWEQTLLNMSRDGIDTFVELGPGKTLSTFVKKTLDNVTVLRVENIETLDECLAVLG